MDINVQFQTNYNVLKLYNANISAQLAKNMQTSIITKFYF